MLSNEIKDEVPPNGPRGGPSYPGKAVLSIHLSSVSNSYFLRKWISPSRTLLCSKHYTLLPRGVLNESIFIFDLNLE